jgi:outer membrane cobalamin receptor
MVRLRPHISVNYQMSKQHRIYAAYEPSVAPLTLATILSKNRYLESSATVGHQDITNSVELGLESDWSVAIRSRCSFRVQSVKDNALFSELSSKPGWGLIYGEKTIIMIGLIEMVAKLTVNDYFAYGVLLRSAKDSFWGNRIPYSSPHEVNVKATHVFGSVASVSMDLKILGERYTDVTNINTIPGFVVLDVSGEYKPMDFLKFFVTVHNLTNTKYYIWNRYQEFPLTIHFAVQLNW